jgi:hypothetical protein
MWKVQEIAWDHASGLMELTGRMLDENLCSVFFISCSTQEERCPLPSSADSPPPPYSPPQAPTTGPEAPGIPKSSSISNLGETDLQPPNTGTDNSNTLTDINKNSGTSSASHSPAGSLRSRNNSNNNNHMPRYEEATSPSSPPPPGFFI